MRVTCLIREAPWYRRDAFMRGLIAAGLQPTNGPDAEVLLIWNRYADNHDRATRHERKGGVVWVAENGYLGVGGSSPKFDVHPGGPQSHHYYSLSRGYHNGGGTWASGEEDRFAKLGVTIKPWRTSGDYFLVCPNRSFGVPGRVMHPDWAQQKVIELARYGVPVRVRVHPGNDEPRKNPLSADLAGARAVFIWSSTVGVHALLEGIPVFVDAPYWVMKGASAKGSPIAPELPAREPAFQRMAWHQFTLAEIQSGWPFRKLLEL